MFAFSCRAEAPDGIAAAQALRHRGAVGRPHITTLEARSAVLTSFILDLDATDNGTLFLFVYVEIDHDPLSVTSRLPPVQVVTDLRHECRRAVMIMFDDQTTGASRNVHTSHRGRARRRAIIASWHHMQLLLIKSTTVFKEGRVPAAANGPG
jgi:hypothetical protein